MPNIWAHFIFGEEVLAARGIQSIVNAKEARHLFRMGCQGPDFLFYHNFLPWRTGKAMNHLGSAMHTEHCGDVLMDLIEGVSTRDLADPSVLYVLGFMLHHVLDRNVHPYVFYRSGFKKWDHQRFEVWMDTLIVAKKLQRKTWQSPVWREIDTGGTFPPLVVDLFEQVTKRYYPDLAGQIRREDWNHAHRDMIAAQRFFHDPSGLKRGITFGYINPLVYKRPRKPLDVLNESRTLWRDPTGADASYTTSVWDQWAAALDDAALVVDAALAYWAAAQRGADSAAHAKERLAQVVGNRSYEHGKPCDAGLHIVVADSIL